ncbi:LOW QUALITY PROTEIN: myb-like protein D [Melanaphis sacchari]|uniref:LOW QUALITY PROTEIN: myb-like protein D n=1 Tax=Melanaphis sacchari TaxID=742174 RepID=UPI000DC14F37|nr:LOW QUALITY PROTEIN: myb-like protein D [Melanaphis sacchari]
MWLSNFFTKTKSNECEDSIDKDIVDEESINNPSNHEEEPVINDLKKRVERVKIIYAKLQTLQNKQDLNLNNCINTVQEKNVQYTSMNENENNLEINNCKIEDVLSIIPIIETNLQTLTEKVSCLSGLIDAKQLNSKIETDQNIITNNSDINNVSNSVNKSNSIEDRMTLSISDTLLGIDSKENIKTLENKQSVKIKEKETDQNKQITDKENVSEYSVKSVDQLANLDSQLESFFKNIQSALTQYKIDQIQEKLEIMDNLSRLENKININYTKMDKLMSNVENFSKINDPIKQVFMKNQSSSEEIEKKYLLQKSKDDIKVCVDNFIKPNPNNLKQMQSIITSDNSITNTDINSTCKMNRCVCQLIDNINAASTQITNSHDDKNQIKCDGIILSEFLKTKLNFERIEEDNFQSKILQLNQLTNQIDDKKNSYLSECSKKSNRLSNSCDVNQINDQTTSHLSLCLKTSNLIKNNGVTKKDEEQNIKRLTVCHKQSIHNFFKIGIEDDTKSNQPITKESVGEECNICDFLSSQPIPNWIRLNENVVASDSLCENDDNKLSTTNCNLNVMKCYNIERIIKDNHDKNNRNNIVYEIKRKSELFS